MDRLLRKGAKFKIADFIENNCRLCRNVYCCKICREKHEINVHKVRPDCDLCIYGKLYTLNTKHDFLAHLQEHHWPLHCVFCKLVFGNMDEIIVNRRCPVGNTEVPNHTFSRVSTKNTPKDESPPVTRELQNNNLKYVTSTPMQRNEGPNLIFKDMHIVITPVDYPQDKNDISKKSDSGRSSVKNRRVTFCETPGHRKTVEEDQKSTKSALIASDLADNFESAKEDVSKKEKDCEKYSEEVISPCIDNTENRRGQVETDHEQPITKEDLEVQSLCGDIKTNPSKIDDSDFTENTLWISALEETDSPPEIIGPEKPLVIIKNTPKPTNAGWPTPVLTRQDYKINFQICKKIFSTPIAATKKNAKETSHELFEPVIHEEKTEGNIYLRKEEIHLANNTADIAPEEEHNISSNLWNSMTKIVKNVIQGFGHNNSNSSIKRSYSENETFLDDSPPTRIKRFKFTDIKCRRGIRDLPAIEYKVPALTYHTQPTGSKRFVDKATQTDF